MTNKYTNRISRGVYSANKLLKRKITNGFYIANTSPDSSKGVHWCAFSVSPKCLEVFDSSGILFQRNKYFKKFVQKCNRKLIFNTNMIQSPKSNLCGQYCLVFALYKARGKSLCNFLQLFNQSNLNKNDRIISSIFLKNFRNPTCYQISKILSLCV